MTDQEEPKKEEKLPQNAIVTVHTTKYRSTFNGRIYELRTPMVALDEIIQFIDYFKGVAEATIAEAKKASEEKTEVKGE